MRRSLATAHGGARSAPAARLGSGRSPPAGHRRQTRLEAQAQGTAAIQAWLGAEFTPHLVVETVETSVVEPQAPGLCRGACRRLYDAWPGVGSLERGTCGNPSERARISPAEPPSPAVRRTTVSQSGRALVDDKAGPAHLALVPRGVDRADREPQPSADGARYPPSNVGEVEGIGVAKRSPDRLQEAASTVDANRVAGPASTVEHPVAQLCDLAVDSARAVGDDVRRTTNSTSVP
jgi:hypothetical protein